MTFEIDDGHWRIRFEHDKPRDWGSHIGCRMPIPPDQSPAVAKLMDALKMSAITIDKDGLYCHRCHVRLAGVSPAVARKLSVPRVLFDCDGDVIVSHGSPLVSREYARNVRCVIFRREGDRWASVYSGTSRLNTGAGDRYSREEGRIAALRDALPKPPSIPAGESVLARDRRLQSDRPRRAFCETAMTAYLERARGSSRKAGGQ